MAQANWRNLINVPTLAFAGTFLILLGVAEPDHSRGRDATGMLQTGIALLYAATLLLSATRAQGLWWLRRLASHPGRGFPWSPGRERAPREAVVVLVLLGSIFALVGVIVVSLAVPRFNAQYCAQLPNNQYCQLRELLR